MHLNHNDESDFIKGLREGDRKAFFAIHELYGKRLLAYCLHLLDCNEDAEDIVQDVFLTLWRNRKDIKEVDTIRPFLFTAARNRILNLWKTRLNSSLYHDYVLLREANAGAYTPAPMEYREFEKRIEEEISKLPPTQMKVVRLSRIENLDTKEIAEKLGLSVQTVKNALSTGLKTLRAALGDLPELAMLLLLTCGCLHEIF